MVSSQKNREFKGNHSWKGNLELLNVIMIGIAEEIPAKSENHELHRLLGSLLSEKLMVDEKINILENEYHIPMEKSLKEDVKTMCNLSEGIEERAMESGMKAGMKKGITAVLRLAENFHLNREATIQQLCESMDMNREEAEKWYEECKKEL